MTHEDAMNFILANACASNEYPDGIHRYVIELHCINIVVFARPLGDFKYDILRAQLDLGVETEEILHTD